MWGIIKNYLTVFGNKNGGPVVLDTSGNLNANVVHRTGALATLLELTSPQGEVAMATDGANAGKLVSILTAGAQIVGGMQVATGTGVVTWVAANDAKNIAVTGLSFTPKLVIMFASDAGGAFGFSLSFITPVGTEGIYTALGMTPQASGRTDTAAITAPVSETVFVSDDYTAAITSTGFTVNNIAPSEPVTGAVVYKWFAFG